MIWNNAEIYVIQVAYLPYAIMSSIQSLTRRSMHNPQGRVAIIGAFGILASAIVGVAIAFPYEVRKLNKLPIEAKVAQLDADAAFLSCTNEVTVPFPASGPKRSELVEAMSNGVCWIMPGGSKQTPIPSCFPFCAR
jgi:hypothetical protein